MASLDVMFEGHCRRGVSRCRLCLLDVFGRIIEVCQNRCAKSARGDGSIKACIALYALAHSPDLRIGQWTVSAENEAFRAGLRQMRDNLWHKVYCPSAGIRFCIFDVWLIAGRMCDGAFNVNDTLFDVNVFPFQTKHFFKAKRMERVKREVCPVLRIFDAADSIS